MTKITPNRKNDIDLFKSCKFVLHATDDELISSSKLTNKAFTVVANNVEPFVDKTAELIGDFGNTLIDGVKALNAHLKEAAVKAEFDVLCLELQGNTVAVMETIISKTTTFIANQEKLIAHLSKKKEKYEDLISKCKSRIVDLTVSLCEMEYLREEINEELNYQKRLIWVNRDKSVEEIKEIIKNSVEEVDALYEDFAKAARSTRKSNNVA